MQHRDRLVVLDRRDGDSRIQANELTGTPTESEPARFTNGVLLPAGNDVDESTKITRTREAIVGFQHELISNFAVGVDYIYRNYDRGTATYPTGYGPGGPNFPVSQIYTGPLTYTDPVTGLSARTSSYVRVAPDRLAPAKSR